MSAKMKNFHFPRNLNISIAEVDLPDIGLIFSFNTLKSVINLISSKVHSGNFYVLPYLSVG